MNIPERNELAIRRFGEKFVTGYESLKECGCSHCFVTEAVNHQKIICQEREGYNWRLNSIYEPQLAAEKYAEGYSRFDDFGVICVFGLSDGRSIRELCRKCNGTQRLIIYEPDHENFLMAMEHFPLEDILEKEWVDLVVEGINEEELYGILDEQINEENCKLVAECIILPAYDTLYHMQRQDYSEKQLFCVKKRKNNIITYVAFSRQIADNMLYNLPYVLKGSSLNNLKSAIGAYDISGIPAIIVSAGPSLDKNIGQLKAVGNRAFIIGVDSALKALLREGIDFHIGISVDMRKNPALFEDERLADYPFVVDTCCIPVIAERNRKHLFFLDSVGFMGYAGLITKKTGENLGELVSGGSVATSAFELAKYLGFEQIILIGQDLAYTDGKTHVSGFAESEANKRDESMLMDVEGMDGTMLRTDIQMDYYRKWFELQISACGKLTVYNATEGGARIHGAVELTLEEAIDRLCNRELDFPSIIENAPKLLEEKDRIDVSREFYALDQYFGKLKKRITEGIEAYQTLIWLEEKGGQGTAEYQEVLRQLGEINELEGQEPFMHFIELYAKQEEQEAAEDIYTAPELTIKEIAERGLKLFRGYEKGIDIAIEKFGKIVKPALEAE